MSSLLVGLHTLEIDEIAYPDTSLIHRTFIRADVVSSSYCMPAFLPEEPEYMNIYVEVDLNDPPQNVTIQSASTNGCFDTTFIITNVFNSSIYSYQEPGPQSIELIITISATNSSEVG